MSKRNNFFGSKSGLTARTIAFLAATGISDTTITSALNTMDLALIANGLDVKMKAIYPFVGGTATTHKFNFMNPADTDAAFRLTFAGGGTHSANGWQTGINAYANTHLAPDPVLSLNSTALSFYSRTNVGGSQYDMGSSTAVFDRCEIASRWSDNNLYIEINQTAIGSTPNLNSSGLISVSRTASNLTTAYRNGASIGSSANVSVIRPAFKIALGAWNFNNSILNFSTKEYCMFSISDGLTSTDESNFYTLIQAFQTSLSRQV